MMLLIIHLESHPSSKFTADQNKSALLVVMMCILHSADLALLFSQWLLAWDRISILIQNL